MLYTVKEVSDLVPRNFPWSKSRKSWNTILYLQETYEMESVEVVPTDKLDFLK